MTLRYLQSRDLLQVLFLRDIVVTQNNDRILKLKEKISGIESTIELEKAKQMERLNSHIEAIDDKLKYTIDERNNSIDSMSNEVLYHNNAIA